MLDPTDLISKPVNFFAHGVEKSVEIPYQIGSSLVGGKADVLKADKHEQLSTILSGAGWGSINSDLNKRARAVVKRESNGDAAAHNPSGATGLFQMMTPLHCGSYGIPSGSNCQAWLEDPSNNARAAKALYDANGWTPWASSGGIPLPTDWDTTVTTKESSGLLGAAGDAASSIVPDPIKDAANSAADIVKALFDPNTYLRLGKGALGAGLLGVGLLTIVMIATRNPNAAKATIGGTTRKVAKTAIKIAP